MCLSAHRTASLKFRPWVPSTSLFPLIHFLLQFSGWETSVFLFYSKYTSHSSQVLVLLIRIATNTPSAQSEAVQNLLPIGNGDKEVIANWMEVPWGIWKDHLAQTVWIVWKVVFKQWGYAVSLHGVKPKQAHFLHSVCRWSHIRAVCSWQPRRRMAMVYLRPLYWSCLSLSVCSGDAHRRPICRASNQ